MVQVHHWPLLLINQRHMVSKKTKTTAKKQTRSKTKKTQSFKATEKFMDKLKKMVQEGNVRRIIIKNSQKKVIAQFPLTFGVIGVILAPIFAAIAAIVALVKDCTITVEKK